jgi:hypothetical protein
MFIAELFTIMKRQNQPNFPSRDKWMGKIDIYASELTLAFKKKKIQ